jgi:hypothetical protein
MRRPITKIDPVCRAASLININETARILAKNLDCVRFRFRALL